MREERPAPSVILTYHSIDPSGSVISTPNDLFARQMEWLGSSGIPVVPLGDASRTPGSVALTFDDGFQNFATAALPVLVQHRLPATVFVVSGYCGRTNRWPGQPATIPELPLMDWSTLQETVAAGIALGAHTVTHPRLTTIPLDRVESELRESRLAIEDRIGTPVDLLAYPYGASNQRVRAAAHAHFRYACGTHLRSLGGDDPYDLPRIDTYYLRQPVWFERMMHRSGHSYIGIRRIFRQLRACLFPSS